MTGKLLSVRDASVTYRTRRHEVVALRDVNIDIAAGQRLAVVGGSGSGKTTLARLMLGLVQPDPGQVYYESQPVIGEAPERLEALRAGVTMVFQDPRSSLNPRMRIGRIVAEPIRSGGYARTERAEADEQVLQQLTDVGLSAAHARRYPHQLSGGQRQRVAIARALISEPKVLIADEPVSSLDVSVRAQVLNLLAEQTRRRGLALVLISHDLGVVQHMCDQIVVMQQGRIVESGAVSEVFAAPQHDYTKALLDSVITL